MIERLLMFGLTVLMSGSCVAAATYTFSGHLYQTANGSYTTAMSVTGNFTTTNPLPANLPITDIQALVTSWSFTDGVNSYTSINSFPNTHMQVQTDGAGNIIGWSMNFVTPNPPWVVNVTPINYVSFFTGTSTCTDFATTGGTCQNTTGNCSPFAINVNNQASYFGACSSWVSAITPTTSVPTLSKLGLIAAAGLIAIGAALALRAIQRRQG
jgi:hypothetical protein